MRGIGWVLMIGLAVAVVTNAHAEDWYVLRPHPSGGPKVYQITRAQAAAQPRWSMGQPMPIPLEKLAQIALDKTVEPNSPDATYWKVEHIYFWRMDDHKRGSNPHFQATADMPGDLQDRWFCEFQLSCYKDYSGGWWKNTRYAVVLLDGTFVPATQPEGGK